MPHPKSLFRWTVPSLFALLTVALLWPAFGTPSAETVAAQQKAKQKRKSRRRGQRGPRPFWIWGGPAGENDRYVFRKEFTAPAVRSARLRAACDNSMKVYLNGKRVAVGDDWKEPAMADVTSAMKVGANVFEVEAANAGGPAGFVLQLTLRPKTGRGQSIITDKSWKAAKTRDAKDWKAVVTLGRLGMKPWGDVFAAGPRVNLPAIERGVFKTLPGFKVEEIYSVPKPVQGSWVSLTIDNKGRLIASDQGNKGLYRITPPPVGAGLRGGPHAKPKVERLKVNMTSCHGMLYAFGSLYCSANGGPGSGLYRLTDTNGDDQFDKVEFLKPIRGGGEHGPHALRLSPDGKSILWTAGNHTKTPENFNASRNPSNWGEDLLLPRQWDARGHARGILAPGGWIAKTDPDGKRFEIVTNGFRNSYDFDFNADGELFVYDADMEWDMGSPWYRPTRVLHATSGSEFGWRSGTGKWPAYYIDSLPPVIDIGPGSPVGVTFGYGTKFPAKYQKALYLLDWTFGTIYVLHLTPSGSTYKATKEEFLSRAPLPLTDAVVGKDGALYFTTGGRNTDSSLFRVTYVGKESTAPVDAKDTKFADLRALRHKLEGWHHDGAGTKHLDEIWQSLSHKDRFIRYAARIALEHVPSRLWEERALSERNTDALLEAAVAFARQGNKSREAELLAALGRIELAKLSERRQLDLLRVYSLVFIRMGHPGAVNAAKLAKRLDPFYPGKTDALNREYVIVLVYLNSPTVIDKTLKLMKQPDKRPPWVVNKLIARNAGYGGTIAKMLANLPEIQNIHYAFALRNMRYGWTLEQRKEYFTWLDKALQRSGGASYQGFINNCRNEALANVSPAERKALESSIPFTPPKPADLPKPKGPGRNWTVADLVKLAGGGLKARSFENGKRAYAAARCIVCHRFDGNGGATGPDLTNVAGRFSVKDLSDSLIDPSKVVSDQYRAHIIVTAAGKSYTGRIATEENGVITLLTDPEDIRKVVKIKVGDIEQKTPSKTSMMPKDLLKPLNKDEVLDLVAYLLSRGNPNDPIFRR
jgi:putative heme-binding domain-containing protein